jgi:hypothetical protein
LAIEVINEEEGVTLTGETTKAPKLETELEEITIEEEGVTLAAETTKAPKLETELEVVEDSPDIASDSAGGEAEENA